ncbi:hypothetical protein ACS0TY_033761 [Phlomoides rotata]
MPPKRVQRLFNSSSGSQSIDEEIVEETLNEEDITTLSESLYKKGENYLSLFANVMAAL